MNNFECVNPVKVSFGKGAIARLSALIPAGSKVLMLYGGGSVKKNGVYDQVLEGLKPFEMIEFPGIEPNPRYETCMRAVELVKKEGCTYLLAVGGGSVIDATKFISAAVYYDAGDPWEILAKGGKVEKTMPLGVVLTLPATGSEMNERAVVSRNSTNEKLAFATPLIYPKFAILDPEVTYSLPEKQVANGVVDSFMHVMEQYLTYPVNAKVQDYFSESLLKVIYTEGRKVLKDPHNYDIRANLMWAASNALNLWIGMGVPQDWVAHRVGYSLTAQYGIDHAETLAIIYPGVMTYMKKEKEAKMLRLGEVLFGIMEGTAEERVEQVIAAVEGFFREMGMKTRLSEFGIGEDALDSLVVHVKKMGWKLGEYGIIDDQKAKEILALRL